MTTRHPFALTLHGPIKLALVASLLAGCENLLGDFASGGSDGGGDGDTTALDGGTLDGGDASGDASSGGRDGTSDTSANTPREAGDAEASLVDGTTDGTASDALSDRQVADGADAACPATAPTMCGTSCVDLMRDPQNCHVCGVACETGGECVGGVCQCAAGTLSCGGVCASCAAPPDGGVSVCSATTCTFACTGAGLTNCGNSCTNVQTDSKNCGACGTDCLAGTCSNSQCQPWIVGTATDGAIFAPGGGIASYLATDGTNVVWLDQGQGVLEVPITGGTPIPLAATGSTSGTFEGLAMAGGEVVWTTSAPALQVASEGVARSQSPAQSLGAGTPQGLSLNGGATIAYYMFQTTGSASLNYCNLGSTVSCSTLVPNLAVSSTSVTGNDVAYSPLGYLFSTDSTHGTVSRFAIANSGLSSAATGQSLPFRLALDSTYVYWATSDAINGDFTIARTPQASPSSAQTVVSGSGTLRGMATDGTFVYYSAGGTAVSFAPVDGSAAPSTLPTAPAGAGTILAVAVAGGAVVWFDASNDTIYGIRAPH
ncbi:MAG TPA: hypothetical protein VGL81_03255 [Polyangiaceae bacterium]|jgi:hypothetical protein